MRHVTLTLSAFLACTLLVYVYAGDSPVQRMTSADVSLRYPKRFGRPVYNLHTNPITPAGVELGRALFHDPILSRDSTTSCSSCHQQFAAFSHIDHALSHGIEGRIGRRNVPALQNVLWSTSFMWDGGVSHLDLQPLAPLTGATEMGDSLHRVLDRLRRSALYPRMFRAAFHSKEITSERLLHALSQFMAILISANAKYDRVMDGRDAFTEQEQKGYTAFRARCASCHPEPQFTDGSFRNSGLAIDTALRDLGRLTISGDPTDSCAFRVPSLRNVELTYPYMHDGRLRTLRAVLDHYARGQFHGANADPALQTTVGMTSEEKKDILAFLLTLTDRSFTTDPRFTDPFRVPK